MLHSIFGCAPEPHIGRQMSAPDGNEMAVTVKVGDGAPVQEATVSGEERAPVTFTSHLQANVKFWTVYLPAVFARNLYRGAPTTSRCRDLPARDPDLQPDAHDHLIVLLHGLLSRPASLELFANELSSAHPTATIWAPRILNRGLATLDDTVQHLWERLDQSPWGDRWPTTPITIVGVSNGSRLACAFDALLRQKHHRSTRHLHLVAPAVVGSSVAGLVAASPLARFIPGRVANVVGEFAPSRYAPW